MQKIVADNGTSTYEEVFEAIMVEIESSHANDGLEEFFPSITYLEEAWEEAGECAQQMEEVLELAAQQVKTPAGIIFGRNPNDHGQFGYFEED